jgi:hypothetical protein
MPDRMEEDQNGRTPDIIRFIRSIQRIEGNPACFKTAAGECDRLECTWRDYCLTETQKNKIKTDR